MASSYAFSSLKVGRMAVTLETHKINYLWWKHIISFSKSDHRFLAEFSIKYQSYYSQCDLRMRFGQRRASSFPLRNSFLVIFSYQICILVYRGTLVRVCIREKLRFKSRGVRFSILGDGFWRRRRYKYFLRMTFSL